MAKLNKNYFAILTILFSCSFLSSCDREGPIERAGEDADRALDSGREKVEDAGDKIEDTLDEVR